MVIFAEKKLLKIEIKDFFQTIGIYHGPSIV